MCAALFAASKMDTLSRIIAAASPNFLLTLVARSHEEITNGSNGDWLS
jgi:hypothetical protein